MHQTATDFIIYTCRYPYKSCCRRMRLSACYFQITFATEHPEAQYLGYLTASSDKNIIIGVKRCLVPCFCREPGQAEVAGKLLSNPKRGPAWAEKAPHHSKSTSHQLHRDFRNILTPRHTSHDLKESPLTQIRHDLLEISQHILARSPG